MRRTALATLAVFFGLAPAAHAWPTLEAHFRTVTVAPALVSAMETPRNGGVGSGVNQSPAAIPVLVAPSYAAMGFAFSQPADSVTVNFGGQTVAATRDSDRAFTLVLPDYPPGDVGVVVAYSTAEVTGRAEYRLTLTTNPPYVSRLQLSGSRLRVKVRCIGPCTGVLTVRTPAPALHKLARTELTGSGWVTIKLSPAVLRSVKRHKRLRVALTSASFERRRFNVDLER